MVDIDTVDKNSLGTKGLVIIGDKFLLYRRDGNTPLQPYKIDVPGGGSFEGETPFETFAREVKEEFGLSIERKNIEYAASYPNSQDTTKVGYFLVARLPEGSEGYIHFGDEGLGWFLMTVDEYFRRQTYGRYSVNAQETTSPR
jgi:8-oxo-dGTP diphosphatase